MPVFTVKDQDVLIDDQDVKLFLSHRWYVVKQGTSGPFYLARNIKMENKTTLSLFHREVMNPCHGDEVDHKNGNGLDNMRMNLRVCTHQQNMMNRKKHKNNTSGYKGVSLIRATLKWHACIRKDGRTIHLGTFIDKEAAAQAYAKAADELFGLFASRR